MNNNTEQTQKKICKTCKQSLPATTDYFHKHNGSKGGLRTNCKKCRSAKKQIHIPVVDENGKTINLRYCKICNDFLEINDLNFARAKRGWLGFSARCKECDRKDREENKEQLLEQSRRYYQENKNKCSRYSKEYIQNNKEYLKRYKANYYKNNKDTKVKEYKLKNRRNILESKKEYNATHTEDRKSYRKIYHKENKRIINEKKKEFRNNNPEVVRRDSQIRKARFKKLPREFTVKQWEQCEGHFLNECCYCGVETKLTQDHFIPLSKNGEYTVNNIVPCCKTCNSSKNNKDFFEWYPQQEFYSKKREQKTLKYLNYESNKTQQLSIF